MEISLLGGNSSIKDSYTTESGNLDNYMLMPEKHLSYFYDIANIGRKTGKRRKSVEKDADGMDNISDFFGEDDSDDDSDDPEDKDDLDTLDGYDETTDASTIISEKTESVANNEETEVEINDSYLIQNNRKIKNNNKEISMSLDEAVERLQKIIEETPSKSKIDMTPVLNSVLKASKLNNENDSLYSYKSLQEAKLMKNLNNENNKENINLVNSITHDNIYEYDEDIKDPSSDGILEDNNDKDDVFETESSSDDEIIIDVNNDKRKLSNKYKSQRKYRESDTETELDLRYSSNSDSESDEVYEYESEDSDASTYYLTNDNNKNELNRKASSSEYKDVQTFSSRKRQSLRKSTRKSIRPEEYNNEQLSKYTEDNNYTEFNNLEQDTDFNNEEEVSNVSKSDMSITKEINETLIEKTNKEIINNTIRRDKEIELNQKEIDETHINKLDEIYKNSSSISKAQLKKKSKNSEKGNTSNNDYQNYNLDINIPNDISNDISNDVSNDISNDFQNDISNNIPNDISNEIPNDLPNDIQDNISNNIPHEIPDETQVLEENLSDVSDKENVNDKEINIQINIPILKSKSKSKKKGKSNSTTTGSSNKRRREEDEEVPLRKSSRKRIPPCKYWEGERPEDLLALNDDEIKELQLKREKEIEQQNQWMFRKRRTKKTIKKENDSEKRPTVKTVDSSTSPIKGLSNPNEADFSKSLSRDFKTEITTYNIYTKKESKRKLVATQKMLSPQSVNNSTYKFTKIFSEDLTFATGLLLFPKGSSKPNRNSKDNILLFFVMTGEIEVQIHKTSFTVYAGDHFIVPKGNQYMIKNLKEYESKVWFVQCKARKKT